MRKLSIKSEDMKLFHTSKSTLKPQCSPTTTCQLQPSQLSSSICTAEPELHLCKSGSTLRKVAMLAGLHWNRSNAVFSRDSRGVLCRARGCNKINIVVGKYEKVSMI